jgi:hypothetical protein
LFHLPLGIWVELNNSFAIPDSRQGFALGPEPTGDHIKDLTVKDLRDLLLKDGRLATFGEGDGTDAWAIDTAYSF